MDFKEKISAVQQRIDAFDGNVMSGLESETAFNGNIEGNPDQVFADDGNPIVTDTLDARDGDVMSSRKMRLGRNGNIMDESEDRHADNGRVADVLRDEYNNLPPPIGDIEAATSRYRTDEPTLTERRSAPRPPSPFDPPSPYSRR